MFDVLPAKLESEPLVRVKPRSKEPVIDNNTPEPTHKVAQWVINGGNVGICLAETDLVVVDVDDSDAATAVSVNLPETFEVKTGSVWFHRYYCWPECKRNTSFSESSVRSSGWMAVIPPSRHPTGGKYYVSRNVEPAEIEVSELEAVLSEFEEGEDSPNPHPEPGTRFRDDLDELDELIDHDGYRADVRDVLEDRDAEHDRRVWLAGFLSEAVGLSSSEVVRLIDRHNRWANYDRETTKHQVKSVIESAGGSR